MRFLAVTQLTETHSVRFFASLHRLWKCLHPFTWVVMLVVGLAMVIIVVPGVPMEFLPKDTTYHSKAQKLESQLQVPQASLILLAQAHGWPTPWGVSCVHTTPTMLSLVVTSPLPLSSSSPWPQWSGLYSWPVFASARSIHWASLFFDILVACGIILAISAATEFCIRRRGGRFRFRIIDLLGLASIVAIAFGWYQYHHRLQSQEVAALAEHERSLQGETMRFDYEIVGPTTNSPELEYCGPDWLVRLVGNEKYLPGLWHFRRVTITTLLPEFAKADIDQLARWPFLNQVTIRPGCPLYAIDKLAELPRLRSLTIEGLGETANTTQSRNFGKVGGFLAVDQLDKLAVVPVESLTLEGSMLTEDIARLLNAQPMLRRLTLREPAITEEEMNDLRRQYPDYSIVAEWFSVREPAFGPTPPDWHERYVADLKRQRAERLQKESSAH